MRNEPSSFRPSLRDSGVKSTESDSAVFTWFGPVGENATRYRYAVIKDEDGILSIQPGEGRFKKGLKAVRFASDDAEDGTEYKVLKTRPGRIDLEPA